VQATVALTPGQTLNLRVGGAGQDGQVSDTIDGTLTSAGGFNGGGTASITCSGCGFALGAGGGGSSDVRTSGDTLADRLLVAGGGGGAGTGGLFAFPPGNGGNSAADAPSVTATNIGAPPLTCTGGTAGTLLGPGAAGGGGSCLGGDPGDAGGLNGGGSSICGVGAGGGGYFGGGSGAGSFFCTASGGGGGSDYPDPLSPPAGTSAVTVTDGVRSGNGLITVSYSACQPTGYYRDGKNMTAAQIGGNVTGTFDATGCNIGVYYGPGSTGTVSGANISGANYLGVLNNAGAVNISNSSIHDIGETQPNSLQHGAGVLYTTLNGTTTCNFCISSGPHAGGTLSGNTITNYQARGVTLDGPGVAATVKSNTVTGYGMINYNTQFGIDVFYGASASITGNTISGNWDTSPNIACGLLFVQAAGVKQQGNVFFNNERDLCNAGRGGGNYTP
jgi:hypothetical protein